MRCIPRKCSKREVRIFKSNILLFYFTYTLYGKYNQKSIFFKFISGLYSASMITDHTLFFLQHL